MPSKLRKLCLTLMTVWLQVARLQEQDSSLTKQYFDIIRGWNFEVEALQSMLARVLRMTFERVGDNV